MKIKISENIEALRQGEKLLRCISDAAYTLPAQTVFDSTIGAHFRHNLDHYACFLNGLDSGCIDYAARQRDLRLEQDRRYAMVEFSRVRKHLQSLEEGLDGPCLLIGSDVGPDQVSTSIKRELEFLLSHTIHHYAIVAIICQLLGIVVEDDFGVAPSTLRHRATQLDMTLVSCA